MSNHQLKRLAWDLIVTKTSFHAGFWCLSLLKRPTRSPHRKTSDDLPDLFVTLFWLARTCGLHFGAAHLWSETNFFRDSNPCGLHSRAVYNPTNTVVNKKKTVMNGKTRKLLNILLTPQCSCLLSETFLSVLWAWVWVPGKASLYFLNLMNFYKQTLNLLEGNYCYWIAGGFVSLTLQLIQSYSIWRCCHSLCTIIQQSFMAPAE